MFCTESRDDTLAKESTGIGLAIVKKLVDYLGGTISVTSTIKEGTEFLTKIPNR